MRCSFCLDSSSRCVATVLGNASLYAHPLSHTSCRSSSSASLHSFCWLPYDLVWASYWPFRRSWRVLAVSRRLVALSNAFCASCNAFSIGESRWTKSWSLWICSSGCPQRGHVSACSEISRRRKAFKSSSSPNLRVLYWVRQVSWLFLAC